VPEQGDAQEVAPDPAPEPAPEDLPATALEGKPGFMHSPTVGLNVHLSVGVV
jgi:hypothetical protein